MKLIAIAHNIRSMHNVGSIFRTADAAGFSGLYLTGYTPGPRNKFNRPNDALLKVSLGAEDSVYWEQSQEVEPILTTLHKQQTLLIGLEQTPDALTIGLPESDAELSNIITNRNSSTIALVLGNEVTGIEPEVSAKLDAHMQIPMHGQKHSLNVSVAFGIAAYYLKFLSNRSS